MDRVIRIDPELLNWSLSLTPEQRLRQANAAFRLYHELHRPFARPFHRGFDTVEEFFRFQKESDLPR
ncbi:MAG: hypothetical protein ACT4PE_18080 [Candidatus Eiseniibacteriota bacterium]